LGFKFNQNIKTILDQNNEISPLQKHLIKTIIIFLGMIIEKKFYRHNMIIDTIIVYYHFQEKGTTIILYKRLFIR
jgi:hypothetical protein